MGLESEALGAVASDSRCAMLMVLLLDALCYAVVEQICPLRRDRCRSVRDVDVEGEVLTVVASDSE